MKTEKNQNESDLIKAWLNEVALLDEARYLKKQGEYERAVKMLQHFLDLEPEPKMKDSILDILGYCHLRLGWFEEAAKAFTEYLGIDPSDNDGRFFLASAYASMKWTDEAIQELKKILASDPTDVLARHDLALCYRDKGWLKESLEEMRKANEYAVTYGNAEENEIVKSSLGNLEKEIEEEDDNRSKIISLLVLLSVVKKMSRLKRKRPKH